MANKGRKENLIDAAHRTEEELRRMTRNGGIKSGEVRRKRKTFRQALEMLLMDAKLSEPVKLKLKEAGELKRRYIRDQRSKHALHSELDDIKGIGPKTKETLLTTYKSVKRIKEATLPSLIETLGTAKGKIVFDYFHK